MSIIIVDITEKKELFDFAATAVDNLEKVHDAKINVISMYGRATNLKYSIRLHTGINQLVRVSNERMLFINPNIAKQLCVELVTIAIIWAHLRPDYKEGFEGDKEADLEAIKIMTTYYKHFDKATFLMEYNRLINSNGTNEERIKAVNLYLNTIL